MPYLDPNSLSLKEILNKVEFEKINRRQKSMKNYTVGKVLMNEQSH